MVIARTPLSVTAIQAMLWLMSGLLYTALTEIVAAVSCSRPRKVRRREVKLEASFISMTLR